MGRLLLWVEEKIPEREMQVPPLRRAKERGSGRNDSVGGWASSENGTKAQNTYELLRHRLLFSSLNSRSDLLYKLRGGRCASAGGLGPAEDWSGDRVEFR